MIAIQTSERNGKVVAAVLAELGETREEIMLISTGGLLIRTRVTDIRVMGRSTQGVTLINLDDGTYLAGLEKVIETEETEESEEPDTEE
jgi:DNA gyrase subunit A